MRTDSNIVNALLKMFSFYWKLSETDALIRALWIVNSRIELGGTKYDQDLWPTYAQLSEAKELTMDINEAIAVNKDATTGGTGSLDARLDIQTKESRIAALAKATQIINSSKDQSEVLSAVQLILDTTKK